MSMNTSPVIQEQFARNIGVLSEQDQLRLQNSTIAIAGCGCIGGFSAELLARMGVGRLKLADPDIFDVSNINRQCAAAHSTVGRLKVSALKEHLLRINPELHIEEFPEGVTADNAAYFVSGSDYVIDAIDYFAFPSSLLLHRTARKQGLFVTTAVALGFGASVLTFDPNGMTLERYIDLPDDASDEQLDSVVFPAGQYASSLPAYATPDKISAWLQSRTIPTISVGQALGPGVLVTKLALHLLNRRQPACVPDKYELQFEL